MSSHAGARLQKGSLITIYPVWLGWLKFAAKRVPSLNLLSSYFAVGWLDCLQGRSFLSEHFLVRIFVASDFSAIDSESGFGPDSCHSRSGLVAYCEDGINGDGYHP